MIWNFLRHQSPNAPKVWAQRYPALHDGICAYLMTDSAACRELIQFIANNVDASTRQEMLDRITDVIRDGFAFAKNGVDALLLLYVIEWWDSQPIESSVYDHDIYDAAGLHLQEYCKRLEFRNFIRGFVNGIECQSVHRLVHEALSMHPNDHV